MNTKDVAFTCDCSNCQGAACTCGCQAVSAELPASPCGCGCNAGQPCHCDEARA